MGSGEEEEGKKKVIARLPDLVHQRGNGGKMSFYFVNQEGRVWFNIRNRRKRPYLFPVFFKGGERKPIVSYLRRGEKREWLSLREKAQRKEEEKRRHRPISTGKRTKHFL